MKQISLTKKIGLSVATSILTLLVVEIVFRAAGIQPEYHQPRKIMASTPPGLPSEPVPFGFVPYSTLRLTYDSDPRGYFGEGNSVEHVHNSEGWRDTDHEFVKPAGTFRVLGLGDSFLFGEGVKRDDVCLVKLRQRLAEANPGVTIEAINTGYPGSNTEFQRDLLQQRGVNYDPDLVILHFVLNDVEQEQDLYAKGPKVEFFKEYTEIYQTPDALSNVSRAWGWARYRFLRQVRGARYLRECIDSFQPDSEKWHRCRDAITDIAKTCREHDVPLLVVVFPFFHELDGDYPFQIIHDTVAEHCESSGIEMLDLRSHYSEYHGPELWVHPTDQHPNEIAHEIAAQATAEHLRAHPELMIRLAKE